MFEDKQQMIMQMEDLYREELFTDLRLGSIRKLIPITADGDEDTSRQVRYSGQAQVMTPSGAIPISFELQAASIGEAVEAFGPAAEKALEETARELEEMRRRAASGIVLPGSGSAAKPGGGILQP